MKCSLLALAFFVTLGSFAMIPLAISKPAPQHARIDTTYVGTLQASLK